MSLRGGKGKLRVQLEPKSNSGDTANTAVSIVHASGLSSDSPPPRNDADPFSSRPVTPKQGARTPLLSNSPPKSTTEAASTSTPTSSQPLLSASSPTFTPAPSAPPSPNPTTSRISTWRSRGKQSSSNGTSSSKVSLVGCAHGDKPQDPGLLTGAPHDGQGSRTSWYLSWGARGFGKGKGKAIEDMEDDGTGKPEDIRGEERASDTVQQNGTDSTKAGGNATRDSNDDAGQDMSNKDTVAESEVAVIAPVRHQESAEVTASPTTQVQPDVQNSSTTTQLHEVPPPRMFAVELPAESVSAPPKQEVKVKEEPKAPELQQGSWLWGWGWRSAPPAEVPAAVEDTPQEAESEVVSPPTAEPEATQPATSEEPPSASSQPEEPEIHEAPADPVASSETSQAETTPASQAQPVQPRPSSWWFWGAAAKPQEQVPTTTTDSATDSTKPQDVNGNVLGIQISEIVIQNPTVLEPTLLGQTDMPSTLNGNQNNSENEATHSSASSVANAPGTIESTPVNSVQRSSAWGFWSKTNRSTDTFQSAQSAGAATDPVARTDSPAPASTPNGTVKSKKPRSQPPSPPTGLVDPKAPKTVTVAAGTKPTEMHEAPAPVVKKEQPPSPAKSQLQKLQRAQAQNHIMPAFESTYWKVDQPGLLCRLTRVFSKQQLSRKHLYITPTKPKVRKAVAIGVHGFFPMKLVRQVLGEPTGTSRRFATHAASAIKRWAEKEGIEVEVEAIALEGEGKVADRVELLWRLLDKHMDHVRSADFVMVAAHSQGVVVGMKLLAKMIEEGCVDNARVGFLAMAGINLGPFYHLPQTILSGSAKELFEFQRSDSIVSRKYIQSIRTVLAHHTRICYVGSIDDQLVPLESSTFSNINHPYIYRAVFVDGRIHALDFLSHLVGFALKLRNLGISDHGLIRELSTPLAGSLYGGEGHSRIYDDGACYDLAIRHALETTDCPEDIPLRVAPFELPTNNNNPFFLPWALRGLLEEEYVRTALHRESRELLEQFERWKPMTKVLKDVKWRLEGIRSKL